MKYLVLGLLGFLVYFWISLFNELMIAGVKPDLVQL